MLIKVNTERWANALRRLCYQERLLSNGGAERIVRYPTWKRALAVNTISQATPAEGRECLVVLGGRYCTTST
jgi:hypothetical protein